MNHTIVSLLLAAAVVPGCVMDREIALENGEQPVANGASDLGPACARMRETLSQLACAEDPGPPSDLYGLYCGHPTLQGDAFSCLIAQPTPECLPVVAPLLDCVAERNSCDPENDCREFWIPECGPSYTPPPPPAPPYEFFTTCERGKRGLDFQSGAVALFEGYMEGCDDGHEYGFVCPFDASCGMECTCLVDGAETGVVVPAAIVSSDHVVLEIQRACGWTVERPLEDEDGTDDELATEDSNPVQPSDG